MHRAELSAHTYRWKGRASENYQYDTYPYAVVREKETERNDGEKVVLVRRDAVFLRTNHVYVAFHFLIPSI